MTTKARGKTCLDCVFHTYLNELGGRFHLCTLPRDCAPPATQEEDDAGDDRDVDGRTYLGTSCDVMRRMGALCGPHGTMWRCADTDAERQA